ncbi:conserved Plasmodium protein, unknown function [Plasmodium berghei]|uniref:Uncharacterized protein n=2 Tax=Plasmodium berghei TaxID=5821 RepID=A0A509ALR8_PLABA|nr:conserved Plasmodium protein, unknown function [Plasmodium berghei ANKA]CXI61597.1 conserved Plasmodium protein, unknown function [Plasmodium berghei]SCM23651.1 conserved Plasmodium protein, unknown function [Plasmodium berghei]SCN26706.1 conserved Plasmodium protein, unknown function [Plasmodium berghei]SCO61001.1 conserved Plasmodium protein, unknown function [Plasmodium berghei]SCO63099.1 conserved Plasmodium protein, unknown function [Plasmodium berghei]|eukprot:XP_034422322.1 conserved Plasmodium protein, unknown function [Plasmodium berghei ANKA]
MKKLNLLFKLYHRRAECNGSTGFVGNKHHIKLKKISYDFYKNSKINILDEQCYENAIKISQTISSFYKNKIYNNQSYILIFKGFMNILLKIKEKEKIEKKKKLLNIMNIFVLYFKDHINIMNEQDITLLLDTNGKCNINNKIINELIINRFDKNNNKNTLFYNLNPKSVCIILNNLYKISGIIKINIIQDIYTYYIINKYSNYTLKQLIIILHSLNKYNFQKSQIIYILNYISLKIFKLYDIFLKTNENKFKQKNTINLTISTTHHNHHNIPILKICEKNNLKENQIHQNNKMSFIYNKGEDKHRENTNEFISLFCKNNKYEVILLYVLSCYNYCNNNIIKILIKQTKNKILTIYNEKEICMLINSISNFFVLKKNKNFDKHGIEEDNYINDKNKLFMSNLIDDIIKCNQIFNYYSHFSIISIYIFLSKLDYFKCYKNKQIHDKFLNQIFYNDTTNNNNYIEKKKKKKIPYFFLNNNKDITVKTLINLAFSLSLNNINCYKYYNFVLHYFYILVKKYIISFNNHSGYINYDINKFIQFLSIQNIQLLCIIYTYLFVNNILFKLNIINCHLFLFFINNLNYINSMYLSQHISSKIHEEINTILTSLKKSKHNNLENNQNYDKITTQQILHTNECFIFPYYIDIYLSPI